MSKAIQMAAVGGPEVMKLVEVVVGPPGPGEALVRHGAMGINFVDTYHRTGLYPLPLPSGLGVEAAGTVEAVGPGVTSVRPGDRVAYLAGPGCYAEARRVPADRLVPLPAGIDDRLAAASLLKGLTAHMLVTRVHPVRAGEWVLVTAAAGGVGQVLVQWLRHLGARVIAVVGTPAKAELVRPLGAVEVLLTSDPVAARVKALTGEGVRVAYDSVGAASFESSLDSLRPFGLLAIYGNASGPVAPVDPGLLARKGSLAICRPTVFQHVASSADLDEAAGAFFALVAAGRIKVSIGGEWPLARVAEAHRALESRATTGSLVLVP